MTRALILELAYLRDVANAAPDIAAAADAAARVGTPLELAIALPAPPAPATDIRRAIDLSGRAMIETLHRDLPEMGPVDLSARREVTLWMPTEWGDMSVTFNRRLVTPSNPHQLIVLTLVFGALLTFVSYIFLRNQLRPIRRLAEAATAFGKGRAVHYRPSGATEVRAAGGRLPRHAQRIERQTQARTYMLSGISHDLRTPLTRLRLGLFPDRRPPRFRPSSVTWTKWPACSTASSPMPARMPPTTRNPPMSWSFLPTSSRTPTAPVRLRRSFPGRHRPRPRAAPPAGASPRLAGQPHRQRAPPRHPGRGLGHLRRPHHPHHRRR